MTGGSRSEHGWQSHERSERRRDEEARDRLFLAGPKKRLLRIDGPLADWMGISWPLAFLRW